jgi:hypothetical protein
MSHKNPKGPKQVGQTAKFVLCFTTELKARIKTESIKMFGDRKGADSLYVEQAMRCYLHMNVAGVQEK